MTNCKLPIFSQIIPVLLQILPSGKEHTEGNKNEESFKEKDTANDFNCPKLADTVTCVSAVAAAPSRVEEEDDSDEERLRVYRKVKKELDEDEEERLAAEVRAGQEMLNFGHELKSFQSLINNRKELTTDYVDSDFEEETTMFKLPVVPDVNQFPMTQESCEDLTNMEESENVKDSSSSEKDLSPGNGCTQAAVFSTGEKEKVKEASSGVFTKQEDETFSHNEDIDDNESHKIDWTTFRLPTQQTDTLDDRLHLFSGGACLGFQAEVAAKASTASRNFWMAANLPEKTFGGIGEGDEMFGTDSDQEKDSDGDAEEN